MNIGLFGGTFNPPHLGHLRAAKIFYTEKNLDKLIIMPTSVSPFKSDDKSIILPSDRLKMTRLCFKSLSDEKINYEISDYEISKSSCSYTIDTIRHIKALYPDCNLFLYIGSDMLFSFEKWKSFKDILLMCEIFTLPRNSNDALVMNDYAQRYSSLYSAKIHISSQKDLCVSSTQIRDCFKNSCSDNTQSLLTENVFEYIIKNSLYENERLI